MEEEHKFDPQYSKRIMIIFAAFVILVLYIETMLIPSLPAIALQYKINAAEVSLIVALYLVSGVALTPIVGKLGDIYGKKRVLMYVLPIYVVAVALTGFSPNFALILVSRTIQGIGLTAFPLVIGLIQEEFPREMVPKSIAILVAMFGLGSAIGVPLGSFVSNAYGWQGTYHTALPLVLITVVVMLYYMKESRYMKPHVKIDYLGAFGLAMSLAMIVFGCSEGTALGWESPAILALFGLGLALLAGILLYERRKHEPILDLKLLSLKNVMVANIITLLAGLVQFFSYQSFAFLFESAPPLGYGYSVFIAGLAIAPFAAVYAISSPLGGRYIPRIGVKPFFISGAIIGVMGFVITILAHGSALTIVGEALVGLGVSLVTIPTINLVILSIERTEMGIALSMNTVFRFVGSALGAPVAGILIAESMTMAGVRLSFYIPIALFVIVAIASFFANEIFGKNRKVSELEKQVSI